MRARLQKYLPIFLIALLVQVFAPIGACWAAAVAVSDPLNVAEICLHSGSTADQPTDPGGPREHGPGCAICCLASTNASVDTPSVAAFAAPYREQARVIWHEQTLGLSAVHIGANAQARAPPFSS